MMEKKLENYINFIVNDLFKKTEIDVHGGTIVYPDPNTKHNIIAEIEYDIPFLGSYVVRTYGARYDDVKVILRQYKKKIMEQIWDSNTW